MLSAYWQGDRAGTARAVRDAHNPKDYAIQKGQDTIALHRNRPQVIEVVCAHGQSLADPDAYAEVMTDLPKLTG